MRNLVTSCSFAVVLGMAARLGAQPVDPPEKQRQFCNPATSKDCSDDTMEVTFDRDGGDDSVFGYETFVANAPVDVTIMMDVKSNGPGGGDGVQGWSYGVDHDDAFLTINSVTVGGTDAERAISGGFVVADMNNIQTCKNDPDVKCKNPEAGTGFISAIILHFIKEAELETRRNSLAKAKYTLTADPGAAGTVIDVTDKLKKTGSPPADVNITINGISKGPTTIVDGYVVKLGSPCVPSGPEHRDTAGSCTDGLDNDCDTLVDAADPDCATPTECVDWAYYFGPTAGAADLAVGAGTEYVISMRNKTAALGFQLGVKATTVATTTTWDLAGTLGTDANRLIELIVTDDQGNSQAPQHPNKATSSTATVSNIERGAAIAGFSTRDFFAFDLAPGVGGPGFTVGYVSDTNPPAQAGNKIPLTGAGTPCPVNEVLKVKLGGEPETQFSRGDANGDSKINVTDAVLIIQIVVGNLQARFTCQDVLDANDDGRVNVTDALPVLAYVFQRGPALPAPFRACAVDTPAADTLVCTQSNCQ